MKRIVLLLFFIMQWSVQAQMVGTPRMPFVDTNDKIRAALSTSVTAYDNAGSNTLVNITSTEYNSILTNVTGSVLKGIDNFTSQSTLGTFNDVVGANSNFASVPNNSYIVAVAFSVYYPGTGAITITTAASLTGPTTCITGPSPSLSYTAYTPLYFAVKKPITTTGTNAYIGRNTSTGSLSSAGKPQTSTNAAYNQNASLCGTAMNTAIAWSPCLQVIATTTKSW